MMKWFDTKESERFAKAIAAELIERIPPEGVSRGGGRKAIDKLAKSHRIICSKTEAFSRSCELNVFQKASFGNAFKWALKEAGYSQAFVDAWTEEILTIVSLNSRASTK